MTRRLALLRLGLSTFFGLAITGCAGGDSAGVDSAGIRIVVSDDSGSWNASSRPTLSEVTRIGRAAGDTNYEFGMPVGVDIGSDGTIYVLDQQAGNIRAFDSTGKFLRTMSRRGTGPGEIGPSAAGMLVTAGDTIVVPDPGRQTVMLFSPDGKPLADYQIPLTEGLPMKWSDREDGSIIVQVRHFDMGALISGMRASRAGRAAADAPISGAGPPKPDQLQLRNAAGKVFDTLLTFPAGETMRIGGERGMKVRLFSPEPMWAAANDGRVFFGVSSEYSVQLYDSAGVLKRIVRRKVDPVPVTEEDQAAIMKAMTDRMSAMGLPPEALAQMKGMFEFAEFFPAIGSVLAGPAGTLWVQRALSAEAMKLTLANADNPTTANFGSRTWDVYDNEGALLGLMDMPERFTAMHWVGNKLVGIEIGGTEEPHVVVLRLSGADRRG